MAQKANSHDNHQKKARQNGLPVSIHPDDAKDKVFTAILKALLKMGNKPSSPKELANIIVKHKYATLGGATPFATVSSRISQHFKRAAEHNPPRAPLLAKHVDQNHSRKINYSLATGDNPAQQPAAAAAAAGADNASNEKDNNEVEHSPTAATAAAKESFIADPNRTNSKTRRHPISITSSNLASKAAAADEESDEDDDEDDDSEEEEEIHFHPSKKHKTEHVINTPTSPSIHPTIQNEPAPSTIDGYTESPTLLAGSDEESDGGLSDYHEEMLKGDEDLDILAARRLSRRQSRSILKANVNKDNTNNNSNTTHSGATNTTTSSSSTTAVSTAADPLSKDASSKKSNLIHPTSSSTNSLAPPPPPPPTATRKPSFSFSSGFPGDQELWTPFSFEHDFDSVFLHDASTAHHIPFNIATPESVSVSELDNYFSSTTTTSTSTATSRSQRKSFSSAMLGPNDKSLLQKVLLASAARGVADKIDEGDEEEEIKNEKAEEEKEEKKEAIDKKEKEKAKVEKTTTIKSLSSSTLMDVDNGEDFVKFEDDEKKDTSPPSKKQPDISPSTSASTSLPPPPAAVAPSPSTSTHIPKIITSTPAPPPPPPAAAATTTTPQTPATPTTTLSAAEILKSMNIQNLNLSALHQMTTSISSLQQISPTFDLAKTMAAYMQSLAKSANANASSSNSPHATDLKSILTRFPALEAFLKKDQVPQQQQQQQQQPQTPAAPTPAPAPPPLVSPSTDFVPNLVSATSSEPVVHTLNPTTPPMYITLIDQIAVCIVVLPKTEHTPEYRIMRRVDTGFINGTVLLTAGGIETESERSMILSFEMERVRMPKKKSELFGTWIPLRRAQELAATCSIQHKLGHFLEDSIESYFPNPLPIQINTRKPLHRDGRLTALALAALRSADSSKSNGFIVPPISRQSSSSGSMGAAQLQELLLTHPHKALKSNGLNKSPPLLGRFNDIEEDKHHHHHLHQPKQPAVSNNNSSSSNNNGKEESSDVDIVNSSDSSVAASSNEDEEDDLSDNDNSHRDLEGMLNRNKQTLHIRPRDLLKKKRKHTEDMDIVEEPTKVPKSRKKTSNSNGSSGGKWSSSSGSNSNGKSSTATVTTNAKKPSTIIIKKSSNATSGGKKGAALKKEEVIDNVVVEHKPAANKTAAAAAAAAAKVETPPPSATTTVADEEPGGAVDDEDEDIDIGGSDFDDDLR